MLASVGIALYTISLLTFTIALGGIFYQHIVEFRNWSSSIPQSLITYREFFKRSDFGSFFRMFMPITSLCLLISIILLWSYSEIARWWMIIAITGMFLTAGFTNSFFVSKHKKLFQEPIDTAKIGELKLVAEQWRKGNYVRIVLMGVTLAALVQGLIYLR